MRAENPIIAIVGAGAVGCYYGGRLAQAGGDVHFLLRGDFSHVQRHGMSVTSPNGNFHLSPGRLQVYDDPTRMPPADLVIVTLKTSSNRLYGPLVGPLLHPDTTILTLQNGLGNEESLAALFGAQRIVGGMAFVCINRVGPGVISHIDHGLIRLGEFGGGSSDRVERLARMFRASQIPCEVLPDLRYGRWLKLVWNAAFNGLGAVMDLTTDQLIDTESGRALVISLMNEIVAVARALGVHLPETVIQIQIEHTQTMGAYRSSMQIDRQEGRPLEVEAILGEPLRAARSAGVATPLLQALYPMALALDAAPRRIAVPATQNV